MQCNIKSESATVADNRTTYKTVTCGDRRPLYDAAGTFCCYVCDKCERTKRRGYNPRIFDSGSRYAATGEESDIESGWPFEPFCDKCGFAPWPEDSGNCPNCGAPQTIVP